MPRLPPCQRGSNSTPCRSCPCAACLAAASGPKSLIIKIRAGNRRCLDPKNMRSPARLLKITDVGPLGADIILGCSPRYTRTPRYTRRFLSTETPPQEHRPYNGAAGACRAAGVGKPAGSPRKTAQNKEAHRNSGVPPRPEGDLHQSPYRTRVPVHQTLKIYRVW